MEEKIKYQIGSNIKYFRELNEFSQETTAQYLKISREMISYYENGQREIDVEKLESLSNLFGVELIDLLEEKEENLRFNSIFAFRANSLESQDLEAISKFRIIVKNFLKIKHLVQKNGNLD